MTDWKVPTIADYPTEPCDKCADLERKLAVAREGLRKGCSCRPGGFTCACCAALKEINDEK